MHRAFFTSYSQTALLLLCTTYGPARIFCLPPYAAESAAPDWDLWTDWATALWNNAYSYRFNWLKVGGSGCLIHFLQPSGSSSQLYHAVRRLYELVSDGAYPDHDLLHFGLQELTYFASGISTVIYRFVAICRTLVYSRVAKESHFDFARRTLELALYWSASFTAS